MRLTVLGQVAVLAGRRRRLLGLPDRGRGHDGAARLRQRRVPQAARATATTRRRRRRGASRTCTRTTSSTSCPTPTRSPTRRASSRCRSTAGPAPSHPARPRLIAPPGARRDVPPRRRRLGQRGPDRERLRARGVRRREREPEVGSLRFALPDGAALHRRRSRSASSSSNGGGRLVFGADCRPTDDADRVRARRRPAADRGHAAAPRAQRRARPPHPARGRRARARRRRQAARADAHLRRARSPLGAQGGRWRPSAARSRSPARAPSTRSDPPPGLLPCLVMPLGQ